MALDFTRLGVRIRNARGKKGMTQEQLAEMLNVSRKHISLLENGDRGISLELLVEAANALDVSISDLLTDSLSAEHRTTESDLHQLFLDCTAQEEQIITKLAQALKAILIEHGV